MDQSLLRVEDVRSIRARLEALHAERNKVSAARNRQRVWEWWFLRITFVLMALTAVALLTYKIHPAPWSEIAAALSLVALVAVYIVGCFVFLIVSFATEIWRKIRRRYLYTLDNLLRYEHIDIAAANDISVFPILAVRKCLDDNRMLRSPDRKAIKLGVGLGAVATAVTVMAKFFELPHFNRILDRVPFSWVYAPAMGLLVATMLIMLWRWVWDVELRDDTRVLEQAEAIIAERQRRERLRALAREPLDDNLALDLDDDDGHPVDDPRRAA